MSAWQVTPDHICALIKFALSARPGDRPRWRDHEMTEADAREVFNALATENARSVAYRYNEPAEAVTAWQNTSFPVRTLTPVECLKSIACLDYQSCEHPEWEQSEAKKFLTSLTWTAIVQLDGYSAAPWGIHGAQLSA